MAAQPKPVEFVTCSLVITEPPQDNLPRPCGGDGFVVEGVSVPAPSSTATISGMALTGPGMSIHVPGTPVAPQGAGNNWALQFQPGVGPPNTVMVVVQLSVPGVCGLSRQRVVSCAAMLTAAGEAEDEDEDEDDEEEGEEEGTGFEVVIAIERVELPPAEEVFAGRKVLTAEGVIFLREEDGLGTSEIKALLPEASRDSADGVVARLEALVVDTFFNLYPGVVTVSDTGRWTARFFNAPTGADMHLVVSFVFNGHVIAATALGLFGTAPATGQPGGPWSVRAAAHEAPPRNRSRKKKGRRGRK